MVWQALWLKRLSHDLLLSGEGSKQTPYLKIPLTPLHSHGAFQTAACADEDFYCRQTNKQTNRNFVHYSKIMHVVCTLVLYVIQIVASVVLQFFDSHTHRCNRIQSMRLHLILIGVAFSLKATLPGAQ